MTDETNQRILNGAATYIANPQDDAPFPIRVLGSPAQPGQVIIALDEYTGMWGEGGGGSTPTGPAGGDLTGTYPNPQIGKITNNDLIFYDGSTGYMEVTSDGVNFVKIESHLPSLSIGGTGTTLNFDGVTVANGYGEFEFNFTNVNLPYTLPGAPAPMDGYVYTYVAANADWEPRQSAGGPPTGPAGGDLIFTYPNPIIGSITNDNLVFYGDLPYAAIKTDGGVSYITFESYVPTFNIGGTDTILNFFGVNVANGYGEFQFDGYGVNIPYSLPTAPTPMDGYVLVYNAGNQDWEPQAPSGGTTTLTGDVNGPSNANIVNYLTGNHSDTTLSITGIHRSSGGNTSDDKIISYNYNGATNEMDFQTQGGAFGPAAAFSQSLSVPSAFTIPNIVSFNTESTINSGNISLDVSTPNNYSGTACQANMSFNANTSNSQIIFNALQETISNNWSTYFFTEANGVSSNSTIYINSSSGTLGEIKLALTSTSTSDFSITTNTFTLNGVVIPNTPPSAGQILQATSPTAASWQTISTAQKPDYTTQFMYLGY